MKRRFLCRAADFALALLLVFNLVSVLAPLAAALDLQEPYYAPALPAANTQPRHVVCTALSQAARAYYTGSSSVDSLMSLSGAADNTDSYAVTQNNSLYTALQTLMTQTHTYNSVNYSGTSAGSLA